MKRFICFCLLVLLISACAPVPSSPTQVEYQDFGSFLRWSPDDNLLAVTANTGLYVYDTATLKQVANFPDMAGSIAAFSDRYLAAINQQGLYVWALKDYNLLFQEKATGPIQFRSLAFSTDGKWLVTGEQKQFRLWELPTGKLAAKLPVKGFVSNLAFTDHNTLIVIEQYQAVIHEWDLQDLQSIRSFEIPRDVIFFTLSENGKVMLVDYGEAGVELWNVETGEAGHYYRGMQGASGWTRLSGNNEVAIVWGYAFDGEDSGMGVWDLAQDERIREFSTSYVNGDGWRSGALNSDGTLLAASNNEGYIYIYDLKSGKTLGEIFLAYTFQP